MRKGTFKDYVFKRVFRSLLVVMFFSCYLIPGILDAQQKLYDDLFSVSFPNEKDGWACGRWGIVLHTSDGGKTWVRQNTGVNYTLLSIHFVDTQNGWVVGDGGTILHTKDGGKTWEKQKSPVPYYLMGVHFINSLKGWVVTERTNILFTEDGGEHWRIKFKDEDYILRAVSFCDPVHGWAVGEYGYIYHTSDGGATWKKQAGFFRISEETGGMEGASFLFDVVAVNPQTAWAVGIDGYAVKTIDGGKTWRGVNTGDSKISFFCVASDGKDTIMIGGKGALLLSVDQGRTWKKSELNPPITYGWIQKIAQRGSSGFIAIGGRGVIYISNSKTSWQQIYY
ncbi:MAG: YCF48-related protein [Thermodesulfobacteriota bacterium]